MELFTTCFLRKNPNFSSVILHIYDLLVLLHRTQKTRRYIMPESEAGVSPVFFMVDTEDRRLPIVQCLACHRTCVPLSCRWTQKTDGSPLSSVWLAIGLVFHFLVGGHRRSTAPHCPVSGLPSDLCSTFLSVDTEGRRLSIVQCPFSFPVRLPSCSFPPSYTHGSLHSRSRS